ncbi:LysR family transcriptional regulator [Nocardioides sp.]|uniref:LysR family transcriptional regulator n=1 Tax=Nocardioides sp. TaxID=35761 RepID=UPI00271F3124|nr:LysR family transcriptional regulator [Nocardioides sp.]MDO9457389.1 LysR family transcriptional regulator [Nocardioides sp.]
MELRQLEMFLAVVDHGRMVTAAESLHVAQSVVSKQVARLERELGLVLFDRTRRSATLSAEGEGFVPLARDVVRAAETARAAAQDLHAMRSSRLRVGTSRGLGGRLGDVLAEFRLACPDVHVDLEPLGTPAKITALARGRLDAAFLRAPDLELLRRTGLTWRPLWDEELVAVVPDAWRGRPLDDVGRALGLARTRRVSNPGVWDLVDETCRRLGFDPLPGPGFSSVDEVVHGAVAGGEAWTVVYRGQAPLGAGVAVLEVPTAPAVSTGLALGPSPGAAALALASAAEGVWP